MSSLRIHPRLESDIAPDSQGPTERPEPLIQDPSLLLNPAREARRNSKAPPWRALSIEPVEQTGTGPLDPKATTRRTSSGTVVIATAPFSCCHGYPAL